ncbi:uncharacterized protein LOC141683595 [Apium graveolens]|uniref:uncharacterized protein LOC141683595 n=1 Tax=Apium graveolens TaxID=4045 RepID=UPI003D78F6CF
MEVSTSDHTPLFLEPFITRQVERHRVFKFENTWLREPMCQKIVEDVWENHKDKSLPEKLKRCSKTLSVWGKEITGSFRTKIAHSNRIIKRTKGRRDEFSINQFREENKKMTETLTQQEVFWKQRSKQL